MGLLDQSCLFLRMFKQSQPVLIVFLKVSISTSGHFLRYYRHATFTHTNRTEYNKDLRHYVKLQDLGEVVVMIVTNPQGFTQKMILYRTTIIFPKCNGALFIKLYIIQDPPP